MGSHTTFACYYSGDQKLMFIGFAFIWLLFSINNMIVNHYEHESIDPEDPSAKFYFYVSAPCALVHILGVATGAVLIYFNGEEYAKTQTASVIGVATMAAVFIGFYAFLHPMSTLM